MLHADMQKIILHEIRLNLHEARLNIRKTWKTQKTGILKLYEFIMSLLNVRCSVQSGVKKIVIVKYS